MRLQCIILQTLCLNIYNQLLHINVLERDRTIKYIGYYDDLNTQQLNEMEKNFAKKLGCIREKYVYNKSANSEKCAKNIVYCL